MAVSSPQSNGSVPPQNVEAETSVLGAVLINEQGLDRVMIESPLKAEDFYRDRHRLIFASMLRLKQKADPEPVDALTVCADLERAGELEAAGGTGYVHSLPAAVPVAANAPHYAKIVKDHALLRDLLGTARDIGEKVFEHTGEPRELLDQAEAALFRIAHDDESGNLRPIEEILNQEIDKLELLSRGPAGLTGTPSGFRDIDDITGGFQPGNLIVLAARPSMGKSALVTNMAEKAAVEHDRAVALFSLEMSETELAQRFIACQARENGDSLRKGRVSAERWPRIVKATEKLARAPIFIDDSSDIGILELRAKCRRLHSRTPLGLIIVDYLQLMRAEDPRVGRVEQVGQMSRGLKILARELKVPVIAVSQLSRAPETRPEKRPILSDLRESGQIEQDADVVMFLYRDEVYNKETEEPGVGEVIIAKHRNGPVGDVKLTFLSRFPMFASHASDGGGAGPPPGGGSPRGLAVLQGGAGE